MKIMEIPAGHALWQPVMDYAADCSWGAGKNLAGNMAAGRFTEWERIIAAVEGDTIAGYCAVCRSDCIPDVSYTPYISYMFVGEPFRGRRISQKLIEFACTYLKNAGFSKVYIVSGEQGLYEKYGFAVIDEKMASYGKMAQIFRKML